MTQIDKSIMKRLAHLKALAEHPKTPQHEAEAAAASMSRILLKYNIDMLQLQGADRSNTLLQRTITTKTNSLWRVDLMTVVARHHLCRTVNLRMRNTPTKIWVIGHQRNVDTAIDEYNDYCALVERYSTTVPVPEYYNAKTYRTNYRNGMIAGINARFAEDRKAMSQDNSSTAIVPLITKEVNDYVKQLHPRTVADRRVSLTNGAGFSSGYQRGRTTTARKELD
jgi:hypothetical protein